MLAAVQEVSGKSTIERFVEIGDKRITAMSQRSALIDIRMTLDDVIESLTICCHHILDIVDVLQAALNLERCRSCLNQFLQMVTLVQVLQRQKVTLVYPLVTVTIHQVELHAAHLGTLTAIGRTPKEKLRGIALAAIADAQGSMNENLQLHIRHLAMNLGYLAD